MLIQLGIISSLYVFFSITASYEQGKRRLNRLLEGKNAYASNLGVMEKIPIVGESGINDKHEKNDKSGNVDEHDKSNKDDEGHKPNTTDKSKGGVTNKSRKGEKQNKGNESSSDNDDLDESKMDGAADKLVGGNKSGDDANSEPSDDDDDCDSTRSVISGKTSYID